MEGLEISVVKLSEVKGEFRIEAEHYQHKYQKLLERLNKDFSYLKDLVSKPIQTGHTPSMKDSRFYGGNIKFVKTDNLRENEIKEPFSNYLSNFGNSEIKRTELQEGDIITTIIGATYDVIARSCIVQKSLLPANINQNIAHIRPDKKKINPEYLNVYLNSKYGKMYLEYLSRQMEQVNLNCEEVGMVKVPIFSDTFQSKIESLVKSAHAKLEESKSLYSQAEDLLLGELGLKDWQAKNTLHTTKKFSDFAQSGRLDAEYYQPKYDDLFEKLSCLNCKRLGKIVSIKKSFDPGSDAYQETGIPFIRVSDISKDGIEKTELHLSPIDFDIPELKPKKDTILFSKDGSIGIAYKVQSDLNVFTSGALLHLVTTDSSILPDYLTLVLNSVVVKLQAERDSNGAIIQHWKPSDIENVIIPILPEQIQKKIASLIQQSFECKAQSKQLLEDAKRMVESEIEKN